MALQDDSGDHLPHKLKVLSVRGALQVGAGGRPGAYGVPDYSPGLIGVPATCSTFESIQWPTAE